MVSATVGLEPIRNDGIGTNKGEDAKESEGPASPHGTTTTISTIAVRAEPHSTVVVALLKSIGYVDLRIDKMHPGLLEIGSTAEENAQLLLIHTDLFQRLLGKQQQVEELLGRAEQLVQEQTEPGDVMVYEAMADGLAAAWKGLSRQLEMRGYILADSQRLYDLALKHEELSKVLNSRLQIEEQPKGAKEEMQEIINELAELTSEGMEVGSNVITQIRVLGSLADNADRPREVFEACLDIEKIMLKMAESWELLEGEWRHLNPRDEKMEGQMATIQTIQYMKEEEEEMKGPPMMDFGAHLDKAEQWLKEAQEKFEKIKREEEEREKIEAEGECIKELQILLEQTKTNQSSLQQLAERIYAQCTDLPPEMSTRCADLLERYNRLWKEIQNRLELFEKSQQWIKDAEGLLAQLAKMRRELGSADEAMAGELGPLAQQKGVALIELGEQLRGQWAAEGGGTRLRAQIGEKIHQLKGAVIEVVQLARERIAAGKAQKLGEKIAALEQWIRKVADPFLQKPIALNPSALEIGEFISRHRKFGADLTDKEQQMQSIQSQRKLLAVDELERLGTVEKRIRKLREMLERRMQLGKKMEQLQKLSRELETSFHFLSSLLQQNELLGNQKDTEQQVRHLLQNLNEHCIQEKHQSDNFQVIANSGHQNDPNLGLIEAMGWSRAQITSHRQQFELLNEKCRIWEQNRQQWANGRPPKFVMTLPDEKLIWEGQRLELGAKIDGDPEPRIIWLKDRKEMRERAGQCRIGWLNGMATLVIEEVVAEDAGEYSLRAENANGCAEGKIILVVKGQEGENTRILHQQMTKTTTTTTMTTRKIVSSNGDDQQPVEELGEFKPRFVKQLENVSVREGEQFQLDCLVVGIPEPKIIWYREEQTVRESDRVHLSFKGDHCTLICGNASNEDAGLYKVLAVNVHGETMNFCRVVIVPPSPKRKIPPPTPPKPSTPVEMKLTRMEQKHQREEIVGETVEIVEKKAAIPPRLEPQLCSQIVREGQTVIFQTFISGSPTPKVQWFYNGQPIQMERPDLGMSRDSDGKCTLTIPCVLLEHAGQYGLEANNEFGQATSSATLNVLLDIGGPNAFGGVQISDGGGFAGEEEMMMKKTEQKFITTRSVSGRQQQQFSVQQNQEMPDGGSHQQSYFSRWSTESPAQGPIYAVSKSEKAESRRTSSDLGDPGYSSLANAPECLRPFPAEITVNEGERTEVDCLILGNPRPKVQWFFNERPIKSSPEFVEFSNIGDTYAIRFSPARLENAGWYRLVAENIRGRNESLTLIHVRPKSMIPKSQQKARRSIGGVQGLLNWQKQKLLEEQKKRALSTPPRPLYSTQTPPNVVKKIEKEQEMPAIMSISAYQPRDEAEGGQQGIFEFGGGQPLVESHSEHRLISTDELLLTQRDGRPRASPPLAKGSPPHFMQTLVSAVLNEGQMARFEAVVTGLPPPRLEWTKNGQPLLANERIRIWMEGGRAILTVDQIGADDGGKYCCMAENPSGMASSSAQLVLRPKTMAPDFVERLVSEEVEEGAFLKWTVRASGEPEPTVCWLRDGQLILEVEGASMVKEAPFVYSLLIGNVQLEDAGQFTCILENNAGEARSTADLVVRPKGAPPGKYVHVTKVTQEKQIKGEELARNETVTIDSQLMEGGQGPGEEGEEEE